MRPSIFHVSELGIREDAMEADLTEPSRSHSVLQEVAIDTAGEIFIPQGCPDQCPVVSGGSLHHSSLRLPHLKLLTLMCSRRLLPFVQTQDSPET